MIKVVLFIILLAIIFSLGSALVQLLSSKDGSSEKMMKSLAVRVALSASFIILLFILYKLGYLEPNIAPR